ncbi:hypothetical protein NXY31_02125 [Bacteroides salyersiae]|nr:hypothetical protein [Bacteroides salyersiae]
MARYILVSKQKAYEKGLIDCNSVVRSNGHEVILTEDDVTRLGDLDTIVPELGATVLTASEALKLLEKKEWE